MKKLTSYSVLSCLFLAIFFLGHAQVQNRPTPEKTSIRFVGQFPHKLNSEIFLAKGEVRVKSRNLNYLGVLRTSSTDLSLHFRLLDKNGNPLWEKNARSPWVIMADKTDVIIMVGKRGQEGFLSIHDTVFEGISIYDSRGNLVRELNDTGSIAQVEVNHDNLILLAGGNLRYLNIHGDELWRIPTAADKITVLQDGQFISTEIFITSENKRKAELFDRRGNLIKEFIDSNFSHLAMSACSPDGKFFALRRLLSSNPLAWEISLFDIRNLSRPVKVFKVSGAPISLVLARNARFLIVVLDKRRQNAAGIERTASFIASDGEKINEFPLENFSISDPPSVEVSISPSENQAKVITSGNEYLFEMR